MRNTRRPSLFRRVINRLQLKSYIFFHRSRRETYVLYDEHRPSRRRKRNRGLTPRIFSFFTTVALMTILAMIYPLRPTHSDQENRDLTPFPTVSLSTMADGSYFSNLSTWFADTFPLRDVFLSLQHQVEQCYGVQDQKITGEVVQSDEIPEVDGPDDDEEDLILPDNYHQPTVTPPQEEDPVTPDELTPDMPEPTEEELARMEEERLAEEQRQREEEEARRREEELRRRQEELQREEEAADGLSVPELSDDAVVEKLSAVISIDNAAYEYYNFVLEQADQYTAAISRAAEQLDGISTVYSIIVPNSMGICVPIDVQQQVNTSDQKAAIKYKNSCFNDKVVAIPVYNTLLKHYLEGEYLYFRTDHHWTALGAYRAYEKFAAAAGFEPTPLDQFIPHEYSGFLGTFYNSTKSQAMEKTPDTVYAYEAPSTNSIHITTTQMSDWLYLVVGNMDHASAGNKYSTFIGGDNPFSYIENPNLDDGSAVMLVKESYGNAFAPFLIENYQYVYIVDYRYISQVDSRKLAQMCEDLNVRDVLFLNTISTTRSKKLVSLLDSFIGN